MKSQREFEELVHFSRNEKGEIVETECTKDQFAEMKKQLVEDYGIDPSKIIIVSDSTMRGYY